MATWKLVYPNGGSITINSDEEGDAVVLTKNAFDVLVDLAGFVKEED